MAARKKAESAPKETLGDRIRRRRLEKGLTQAQLGKLIGASQRVVAYYEGKGSSPSPEILVKIADALDVTTDALLGRKKGPGRGGGAREPTVDVRRLRHLKRLEELPLNERKALFKIIDALTEQNARRRSS